MRYEFELDEDREPLYEIVKGSFEKLGFLVNDMVNNITNVDALHMIHMVCKIFYSANQLLLCPSLMEGDNLNPWLLFFKTLMDMQLQPDQTTKTDDVDALNQLEKSVHWKVKGIASKITYRLFCKYSDVKLAEDKDLAKEFCVRFNNQHSLSLLESHL